MSSSSTSAHDLKERWKTFQKENPGVRIRNAAAELGVSEAELVATGCGAHVARLESAWPKILRRLEELGTVMALTRNDGAVHEKAGVYRNVSFSESHDMGQVLDEEIDLRLFMNAWATGFAVKTPWKGGRDGLRRSLQFFAPDGTAVHKTFLTPESDVAAYRTLVNEHRHVDQSIDQPVAAPEEERPESPDEEIDSEGFLEEWAELDDTHDFFPLLRKYGVSRTQALRLGENRFTRRVSEDSIRETLQVAAEQETPIMVFVDSPGCLQIHTGPVHTLEATPPWYNVLDPGFQLHVNEELIDQSWVVKKPVENGHVTSLELIDAEGGIVARLFGRRMDGASEREDWRSILEGLPPED